MSEENNDRAIKVILLGEAGVGKTNLIRRVMGLDFDKNLTSTVISSYCENDIVIEKLKYFKIFYINIKLLLNSYKIYTSFKN